MFNEIDLYRPVIDPLLLLGLCVAAVSLICFLYLRTAAHTSSFRRTVLLLSRLLALAAIAWMLAGPSVWQHSERGSRPRVVVFADVSASMATEDAGPRSDQSRLQALRNTLLSPAFLSQLDQHAEVELFAFDNHVRTLTAEDIANTQPDGDDTYLFSALHETLRDDETNLAVLLSDGRDTQRAFDPAAIKHLSDLGLPIHTVIVGQARASSYMSLTAWAEADFVFEGQSTAIRAVVQQQGHDREPLSIELWRNGRLLQQQEVFFEQESALGVRFAMTPMVDRADGNLNEIHDYELRLVANETVQSNQPVFIAVSRDRMRIALFEGSPSWDTRDLARVLRLDPRVALDAFYQLGPDRRFTLATQGLHHSKTEISGSISQTQLNTYDLVILGREVERFFPAERASMLVDYVRQHGGAIIMARGRAFLDDPIAQQIIAELEPVTWGESVVRDLQLQLTKQGEIDPLTKLEDVVLRQLPDLVSATQIHRNRAASVVLLRQQPRDPAIPAMAAVAHQRVGRGQVFAVLGEGLWQWKLLPAQQSQYASVYASFWGRAVRWLVTGSEFLPGRDITLRLDQLKAHQGEPVRAKVLTRALEDKKFKPALRVKSPSGLTQVFEVERRDVATGAFEVTITPEEIGLYRLELFDAADEPAIEPDAPLVVMLPVENRSIERTNTTAQPRLLKQIADQTGGLCLDLNDGQTLLDEVRRLSDSREIEPRAAYDLRANWVFVCVFGGLCLEWTLRRLGGLL